MIPGPAILDETEVSDWAKTGNTDLIPAPKYRAPTASTRGAPVAITNTVVDDDAHTGGALYAWARSHVKRLIERIVPAWARDVGTPIPADKLINAPSGGGGGGTSVGAAALVQREVGQEVVGTAKTTLASLTIPAHTFGERETWLFMVSLKVGASSEGQWGVTAELHEGGARVSESVSFEAIASIGNNHQPGAHTAGIRSIGEALDFNHLHTFGFGDPEDITVTVDFSNDSSNRRIGEGSTITALRLAAGEFAQADDLIDLKTNIAEVMAGYEAGDATLQAAIDALTPVGEQPVAGGRALVQHQFNSHRDLYTAASSNPYFTFPYPAGTDVASWRTSYVTGYLDIDSRISSFLAALGGAQGWPLTGLHASLMRSLNTGQFNVSVSFLDAGIRLTLNGFGSIPSGDRARFILDLTALA